MIREHEQVMAPDALERAIERASQPGAAIMSFSNARCRAFRAEFTPINSLECSDAIWSCRPDRAKVTGYARQARTRMQAFQCALENGFTLGHATERHEHRAMKDSTSDASRGEKRQVERAAHRA